MGERPFCRPWCRTLERTSQEKRTGVTAQRKPQWDPGGPGAASLVSKWRVLLTCDSSWPGPHQGLHEQVGRVTEESPACWNREAIRTLSDRCRGPSAFGNSSPAVPRPDVMAQEGGLGQAGGGQHEARRTKSHPTPQWEWSQRKSQNVLKSWAVRLGECPKQIASEAGGPSPRPFIGTGVFLYVPQAVSREPRER